jgi:NAD(P)-dependent dehydrogenase (short-subunit alcohol dehydrogenase family)
LDVTDREACFREVERCEANRFLDYSAEDFNRLLQVNLFGPLHLMQAALPKMQQRKYGNCQHCIYGW